MKATPLFACALLLLAGCGGGGGGSGGGGGGGGGGGPQVVLDDTFDAPLSTHWIDFSVGQGSATSGDGDNLGQPPHGNPTPGLWLLSPDNNSQGVVQSNLTFPTTEFTFGVDLRFDSGPSNAATHLYVQDVNGTIDAALQVRATSVTYTLREGTQDHSVTHAVPTDTLWHRFELTVYSDGDSEWRRDGVLQQTSTQFPLHDCYLRIFSPIGSASVGASSHVDNVLVTIP